MNKKNNDGIGNHPEAQKIKDICDITPKDPVCQFVNTYRKKKTKKS